MDFTRQQDLVDLKTLQRTRITLIGVGAVGSFIAFNLAKMGLGSLDIYDSDVVEAHNIPNQIYKKSHINKYKVEALKETIEEVSETTVNINPFEFEGERGNQIVVSAVDSIESRQSIWSGLKRSKFSLYIDTRMGGLVGTIFALNIRDKTSYEQTLDAPVVDLPCTARGISFTSSGISCYVASLIKKYIMNENIPKIIYMDFQLFSVEKFDKFNNCPYI